MLNNFRTYTLSLKFYKQIECLKLPQHLKLQILRSSSSIALNLAEGSGRSTAKDKKKFYQTSFASALETQAILELGKIKDFEICDRINHIQRSIYNLIKNTK